MNKLNSEVLFRTKDKKKNFFLSKALCDWIEEELLQTFILVIDDVTSKIL